MSKSMVIFNPNVATWVKESIKVVLGVEAILPHEKYLGLPTFVEKNKCAI